MDEIFFFQTFVGDFVGGFSCSGELSRGGRHEKADFHYLFKYIGITLKKRLIVIFGDFLNV